MYIDMEEWLDENGYDSSKGNISDEMWDEIENAAEEMAQDAIDDSMDEIGQEIVMRFKLKKVKR